MIFFFFLNIIKVVFKIKYGSWKWTQANVEKTGGGQKEH